MIEKTRVTVWCEHVQDRDDPDVRAVYPEGMHEAIAAGLERQLGEEGDVRTSTLHGPECGLSDDLLDATDVLVWWGHVAHDEVTDERAARVQQRVLDGMGLVMLHSGHMAKPFGRLLGTGCMLRWGDSAREVVWTVAPSHPIAQGVRHPFVIPEQETYCEYFDIPAPDELVFVSTFSGGEVFRSGCCWARGEGRLFYFGPGHQTFPVYRQPEVQRVLGNAVRWCHSTPSGVRPELAVYSPPGWYET